jgi:hypothetical protein
MSLLGFAAVSTANRNPIAEKRSSLPRRFEPTL